MDTEWMGQGKCKDMDPAFFFPSDGVGVRLAQNVCADCPVKAPCLEYALAYRVDDGVWGGTSERQRKRILRRQRAMTTSSAGCASSASSASPTGAPSPATPSLLEPVGRP
jgi:WhiB family transcriptional regulator, redox-sensing transcriptional regulator